MRRSLDELVCPYSGGPLRLVRASRVEGDRLLYGLVESHCFTFPVIDGVLLLSLANASGGPEEAVAPYVPIQVAAIRYLDRDDVDGLKGWLRRHVPLVAELVDGGGASYLEYLARLSDAAEAEISRFRRHMQRLEVLRGPDASERESSVAQWYATRFFSPRANALALQLGSLPVAGRVLSLCCRHGVFENFAAAAGWGCDVVSVDAQLLNLLITKRYANPDGDYLCHDVQTGLPFTCGAFHGVFSSACLPEIPTQRSFVREAIRVTRPRGWTLFDSIWGTETDIRVNPLRHDRVCESLFKRLNDYVPFVEECAGGRDVGLDIPGHPEKYARGSTWLFGAQRADALRARQDHELSLVVCDHRRFAGFCRPSRPWMSAQRLVVSPAFDASGDGALTLRRRAPFAQLAPHLAPVGFPGYPEAAALDASRADDPAWLLAHYARCELALLPREFSRDTVGLRPRKTPLAAGSPT